jgi:5-hydroxyisourate hydrolase
VSLSTHVLDAARGVAAQGVALELWRRVDDEWVWLGAATTDADGRSPALSSGPAGDLEGGIYRLVFDTGSYFARMDQSNFYPEVTVTFEIMDPGEHYHVPLLLSPFSYSTYRGS